MGDCRILSANPSFSNLSLFNETFLNASLRAENSSIYRSITPFVTKFKTASQGRQKTDFKVKEFSSFNKNKCENDSISNKTEKQCLVKSNSKERIAKVQVKRLRLEKDKEILQKNNFQRKEKVREGRLNQILNRPGTMRWLKSSSGARMKVNFPDLSSSTLDTSIKLGNWDTFGGYIGPKQNAWINPTPIPRLNTSQNEIFIEICQKDRPWMKQIRVDTALTYLTLRKKGCSKQEAVSFSSKNYCSVDVTQIRYGPAHFRKILRKDNSSQGPMWHGWQHHQPIFDIKPSNSFQMDAEYDEDYKELENNFQKIQERFNIIKGGLVKIDNWQEKIKSPIIKNSEKNPNNSNTENGNVKDDIIQLESPIKTAGKRPNLFETEKRIWSKNTQKTGRLLKSFSADNIKKSPIKKQKIKVSKIKLN
ncbi:unnamed protein product [Blepharisma stoltei]|uniref:Uncharacterized protein n=1 Tax=Blepharisma stoltei TaxID=1481888 RepID=A0AAU9K8S9_9CILI|nr:unnamed protein product [Blepharisma stoltei]